MSSKILAAPKLGEHRSVRDLLDKLKEVEKTKKLREKINRPMKMSKSYYAAYLIEEGLKAEESKLSEEEKVRETSNKKG